MSLLEVNNIHTYYGKIHALKGISITVEQGQIVTLIGANGAGKTTTLNTISGITPAAEGNVDRMKAALESAPAKSKISCNLSTVSGEYNHVQCVC